ncbi:hypothetical protein DM02DRAFT_608837 [Periconia macrospinosa]|uniref:Uncharacterized protein n=1 Tax=Periconia macrospinosa TaxID=97972 RepID=A0A2V1EAW2_9PLEO|nr:hypothetical protein DM02DRAFT_608837 [Periconia macrospinosa]
MAAADEANTKNNTGAEDAKQSRKRMLFRRWRLKDEAVKAITSNSPVRNDDKKQEPPSKKTVTPTINEEDEPEDKSPMRILSPRATDSTFLPTPTPSRRRHFWSMKKKPLPNPSPLYKSMSYDAAKELQGSPTPVTRKGMSAAEIKQVMSAFAVPEQKNELEVNASLAQSPGKGAALGSHPPSSEDEDNEAAGVVLVGDEKMKTGRRGLENGKRRSERRENRSTELLG